MKTIHMHKLSAVMEMKLKTIFSKNFIIMPLFSIGFTFIMKLVYGAVTEGGINDVLCGLALSYGALMNITGTGIYCGIGRGKGEAHAACTDDLVGQWAGILFGQPDPVCRHDVSGQCCSCAGGRAFHDRRPVGGLPWSVAACGGHLCGSRHDFWYFFEKPGNSQYSNDTCDACTYDGSNVWKLK